MLHSGQSGSGAMAVKGYSAFPKSPALLNLTLRLFSVISRHSLGGLTPLQRCSQCILQPQLTGQSCFCLALVDHTPSDLPLHIFPFSRDPKQAFILNYSCLVRWLVGLNLQYFSPIFVSCFTFNASSVLHFLSSLLRIFLSALICIVVLNIILGPEFRTANIRRIMTESSLRNIYGASPVMTLKSVVWIPRLIVFISAIFHKKFIVIIPNPGGFNICALIHMWLGTFPRRNTNSSSQKVLHTWWL